MNADAHRWAVRAGGPGKGPRSAFSPRHFVREIRRCSSVFLWGVLALCIPAAAAADRLVHIDTRPGVKVAYWWMERPDATATVILLPGGEGGIGGRGGMPTSRNFLVRNRDRFAAANLNVAVVGRPSDRRDLTLEFRTSREHVEDVRRIVERLKRETGKPVWLVGTSRGTTSAASAAIALGPAVEGLVLASSITNASLPGAVQNLPLARIGVPVLLMHHRRDACKSTPPGPVQSLLDAFANATVKRIVMPTGGGPASGGPCKPGHWHGFAGMDEAAVAEIVDFVRNPKPDPP
jgi:pimeloyl-ACP methyl ester carboxylesterase